MVDGVALVTGAGSGMGQLMCWRLAAAGVPVAALDERRPQRLPDQGRWASGLKARRGWPV